MNNYVCAFILILSLTFILHLHFDYHTVLKITFMNSIIDFSENKIIQMTKNCIFTNYFTEITTKNILMGPKGI